MKNETDRSLISNQKHLSKNQLKLLFAFVNLTKEKK